MGYLERFDAFSKEECEKFLKMEYSQKKQMIPISKFSNKVSNKFSKSNFSKLTKEQMISNIIQQSKLQGLEKQEKDDLISFLSEMSESELLLLSESLNSSGYTPSDVRTESAESAYLTDLEDPNLVDNATYISFTGTPFFDQDLDRRATDFLQNAPTNGNASTTSRSTQSTHFDQDLDRRESRPINIPRLTEEEYQERIITPSRVTTRGQSQVPNAPTIEY